MPPSAPYYTVFGAGVAVIVCAAATFVYEYYNQEKRRHAMAREMARMDSQLSTLRQELDKVLAEQRSSKKRSKRRKGTSVISSSTTDEYATGLDGDSSDLEFYDVSDDERDTGSTLDMVLNDLDQLIDSDLNLEHCVLQLEDLCMEHPENPQLLWRIGKVYYKLQQECANPDLSKEYINKGIEACKSALKYAPPLPHTHKWLGFLIGARANFQPLKEKILDGYRFKEEIDKALELDPNDASLHYSLGMFCMEIAALKWYERQVAAALFAEPPSATYEDALNHFLKADLLGPSWKENKLAIAKCKIQLGNAFQGVEYLRQAKELRNGKADDVDVEIDTLLTKYT